jgi:hypothetical protein
MKGKGHLQYVGIDGREVLKLDLKKHGGDLTWPRTGPNGKLL